MTCHNHPRHNHYYMAETWINEQAFRESNLGPEICRIVYHIAWRQKQSNTEV